MIQPVRASAAAHGRRPGAAARRRTGGRVPRLVRHGPVRRRGYASPAAWPAPSADGRVAEACCPAPPGRSKRLPKRAERGYTAAAAGTGWSPAGRSTTAGADTAKCPPRRGTSVDFPVPDRPVIAVLSWALGNSDLPAIGQQRRAHPAAPAPVTFAAIWTSDPAPELQASRLGLGQAAGYVAIARLKARPAGPPWRATTAERGV